MEEKAKKRDKRIDKSIRQYLMITSKNLHDALENFWQVIKEEFLAMARKIMGYFRKESDEEDWNLQQIRSTLKIPFIPSPLPVVVFEMDGTEHFNNEETGCCTNWGGRCECGGWLHWQPVYGGYYYKCDKCKEEQI